MIYTLSLSFLFIMEQNKMPAFFSLCQMTLCFLMSHVKRSRRSILSLNKPQDTFLLLDVAMGFQMGPSVHT